MCHQDREYDVYFYAQIELPTNNHGRTVGSFSDALATALSGTCAYGDVVERDRTAALVRVYLPGDVEMETAREAIRLWNDHPYSTTPGR